MAEPAEKNQEVKPQEEPEPTVEPTEGAISDPVDELARLASAEVGVVALDLECRLEGLFSGDARLDQLVADAQHARIGEALGGLDLDRARVGVRRVLY